MSLKQLTLIGPSLTGVMLKPGESWTQAAAGVRGKSGSLRSYAPTNPPGSRHLTTFTPTHSRCLLFQTQAGTCCLSRCQLTSITRSHDTGSGPRQNGAQGKQHLRKATSSSIIHFLPNGVIHSCRRSPPYLVCTERNHLLWAQQKGN